MASKKYDWERLKLEFMASESQDLRPWLESQIGKTQAKSGQATKKTAGWAKEKTEFLGKIQARAIRELERDQAQNWKPKMKELGLMHNTIITLYKAALNKMFEESVDKATGKVIKMPDLWDVDRIWKVVKTEKGEPITVTKSDNNHTGSLTLAGWYIALTKEPQKEEH